MPTLSEEKRIAFGLPEEDVNVVGYDSEVWSGVVDKIMEGVESERLRGKIEHFKECPTCAHSDSCGAITACPTIHALAARLDDEVQERLGNKPVEEVTDRDEDFDTKVQAVKDALAILIGKPEEETGVSYVFAAAKKGLSYHTMGMGASGYPFNDLIGQMLADFRRDEHLGPEFLMSFLAKVL